MSLFEELKRRNVFRVAVAYLITAWVLLQIADLVLQNIHAPDWVIQAFMLALGLGFPLAVIFAWAFEMTPEGIKKEKDVDRTQSITSRTGRKLDFTIIGVLVIAVALLLLERFAGKGSENPFAQSSKQEVAAQGENGSPAAKAKSIAVLPFVNMSSDPEQDYFSDGIAEEILNALAKVKELKVAGRTSSFEFKGQNQGLRKIGETLGVENILEGSVRKSGSKVRITAQLIQVEDGFHLWSDTYDRELTDIFAIQDEIAKAILTQLKAQLLAGEAAAVVATRANSAAYDLYLLAKQRMYERSRPTLEAAAQLLDKAIAIDPDYAPAYAQRGITALLLSDKTYGVIPAEQAETQARLYIDQALRLNANDYERLAKEGHPWQRVFALEQLDRREEATLRAQQQAKSGDDVGTLLGLLVNSGQQEAAVQFIEERWPDLDAYEAAYPILGDGGVGAMLDIAYAYAGSGNEARFNDAMRRAKVGLEALHAVGVQDAFLPLLEAVHASMAGDPDTALDRLSIAVDRGLVLIA